MAPQANSLYSWPSNPTLTCFHLTARAVLLLTNAVGLSVSYAAGAGSNKAPFWVAGAFMSASLIFFQPLFIAWNKKQFNRSKAAILDDEQIPIPPQQTTSSLAFRPVGTKFLEFSVCIDTIGVLGYWITWGLTIRDSISTGWSWRWYNTYGLVVLMTYAGAATLACACIHSLLLLSQLLQLRNAYRISTTPIKVCPHCNHSLQVMVVEDRGIAAGKAPASIQAEETQNLLGREDYDDTASVAPTVIKMTAGQETGTCAITPRESTSSGTLLEDDAGTANESGIGESDRLIEKSE